MSTSLQKETSQRPIKVSRIFMNSIIILAVIFFIVILVLNAIFLDPLFQLGVNIIHVIQVGAPSKAFEVIMNIFSIICNTPVISAIFLLEMGFAKHKLKAIIKRNDFQQKKYFSNLQNVKIFYISIRFVISVIHLSFFLIGFHIIAILKQAYQQSRPIWVSDQISKWQWFCPTDFGNPSGHSYVAFPLFEPIISKYIRFERLKIAWAFVILFGVVVPFSRMYLGVHSFNQIFFGFTFGMIWIVCYRYGLRQLFYKTFGCLLKLKKRLHLATCVSIHLVLTIIPLIIFGIRSNNTPLDPVDLSNLNRICGSTITSLDIQSSMLALCILHSVGFGFMYGFMALNYKKEDLLYFTGKWQYAGKSKTLLHCIAQILCAGVVPAIVVLGFGSFWKEPYSKYVCFNLSLTVGGFLYIWLTPKLERKYNWIKYWVEQKQLVEGIINKSSQNQFEYPKKDQPTLFNY